MQIKRFFYVFLIFLLINTSCKLLEGPEIISGTYKIIKFNSLTFDEYHKISSGSPIVEKIQLNDYEKGSNDFKGKILIKDTGWINIQKFSHSANKKFKVDINNLIEGIQSIWFYINEITEEMIKGDYEYWFNDESKGPGYVNFFAVKE